MSASNGLDADPRRRRHSDASDLDRLVRSPRGLIEDIVRGRFDLRGIARTTLTMTLVCGVGYGAVLGTFRGGRQIPFAALKVPLLFLITIVFCTPAFVAIARALEVRVEGPKVIALGLVAAARGALVLSLLAPVQWLLQGWVGYHAIFMVTFSASLLAGAVSARAIFAGMTSSECAYGAKVARYAAFGAVTVYAVVGLHASWLMRPFIVRPHSLEVPFLRGVEGDMVDSFGRAIPSVRGVYLGPAMTPCGGSEAPCK